MRRLRGDGLHRTVFGNRGKVTPRNARQEREAEGREGPGALSSGVLRVLPTVWRKVRVLMREVCGSGEVRERTAMTVRAFRGRSLEW